MELEELEDLFEDLDASAPSKEQLFRIYGIYLDDFVRNEVYFEGKKVVVNRDIVKDRREGCFVGKQKTFDHLVTRKNCYTGKRQYDKDRANKIHWVRTIIECHEHSLIKRFEKNDAKGHNNILLWYEEKKYIVILREERPDLFLVTGYCVDDIEQGRFRSEYKAYKNKETSLRK